MACTSWYPSLQFRSDEKSSVPAGYTRSRQKEYTRADWSCWEGQISPGSTAAAPLPPCPAPEHPYGTCNRRGAGLRGVHVGFANNISQRWRRGGSCRQNGPWLRAQQRVRSSTRHEAQEKPLRSPAEPEELVQYNGSPHLSKIGFRSLKSDPCVYVYKVENGSAILTLYVDDVLLLGTNKQLLEKLKKKLMDRFEMTDMDDVSRVLGMNVTRDRVKGTITINQKGYFLFSFFNLT